MFDCPRVVMRKIIPFFCFFLFSANVLAELPDFTEMVKKNGEAVVNISIALTSTPHSAMPQFGSPGTLAPYAFNSVGTGFIISKDGYILTNHHVIKDAADIMVKLKDRREFPAKLVGTDIRTDMALLKVEASRLPKVKIGKPDKLKVGEWVVAIGSPFGLEQTVTAGIVSAKGRSLPDDNYVPFIQSDVAINPGNSGGPLFNLEGEVVGINSQIYSRSGNYQGISFAIPIDVVMNVVSQLKNQGQVARGWMGVQTQDVTLGLAESFSMEKPHGALISEVVPRSPADEAGFRVGDIVVAFNGVRIGAASELPPKVGMLAVGDIATADIIRQGERKTIEFEVGLLAEDDGAKRYHSPFDEAVQNKKVIDRLGVVISNLTDDDRQVFDVSGHGVLVHSVLRSGAGFLHGIQQGDVILSIQGNDVRNMSDVDTMIGSAPVGSSVAFLIQRRGMKIFLPVKLF